MKQRIPDTFPHRLLTARRATGLTQQKVADRIGTKRPNYANWELGTNRPSSEFLFKIAELFGVSAAYLQLGETAGQPVQQTPANRFDMALQSIRACRWTGPEALALKAIIDVQVTG